MTRPGFSSGKSGTIKEASILEIDAASQMATALIRGEKHVSVDLSYHVGATQVTPSVGEQWLIQLLSTTKGTQWVLNTKLPFNSAEVLTPSTEGQQQVGTGDGPIQLQATQVNANGVLRLASGTLLSGMAKMRRQRRIMRAMRMGKSAEEIEEIRRGDTGGLPDPTTVDSGGLAYDEVNGVPTYTDGTTWNPLATADQVASKYVLPPTGVPSTDLSTTVQSALTLAGTALQSIPVNSVGAANILPSAVGTTQLSSGVNAILTLAGSALQTLSGSPYDISFWVFAPTSQRIANSFGDNPLGIKIQRACTITSATYRCVSADASGNVVVALVRNGTIISATQITITAANQVTGGSATFTQALSAGDILTGYVVSVGTTPGFGLSVDVTGVMT